MLLAAFALFAGLAVAQSLLIRVDTSYSDQLDVTWQTIRRNVHLYPQDLALIWGTKDSDRLGWALYLASGAFAALGWITRVAHRRGRAPVLEVFAVLYLIPVVVWPTYQGTRFLIAWIPIYMFLALAGVRVIGGMLGRHGAQAALVLSLAAVSVTYGKTYAHIDYGPIRTGVERPATRELFAYVRTHTSANDVFLVKRPRAFALFTGRSASVYHQPAPMQLLAYIDQIHASYVIVGPEDGPYLRSFVSDSEDRLREVFRNTEFKMYQVTTGPA